MEKASFYVYVHLNPLKEGKYKYGQLEFDYEPFYIGKGCGYRCKKGAKVGNQFKTNIINKIKNNGKIPIIQILFKDMLEKDSLSKEIELIKLIGRRDKGLGPLTNVTDGGDHSSHDNRPQSKQVYQYDLEGNYVTTYLSAGKACVTNSKFRQSEISKVARLGGTRYGYQWFYEYEGLKTESNQVNNRTKALKKVDQYQNGRITANFISLEDASNKTGHRMSRISECCNGKRNEYKGYIYKFADT